MIVTVPSPGAPMPSADAAAEKRRVFHTVENDRMAGRVPAWQAPAGARETAAARLAAAAYGGSGTVPGTALAYAPRGADAPREFGFADLVDMVNPLQHIPLVGTLYRHVTGDEIHPISRIIGGAVYGGAAGAASSLVNVAVEHETGRDVAGNVMALVHDGGAARPARPLSSDPAVRLADVMPDGETVSPRYAGLTAGWHGDVFVEPSSARAAARPVRYAYND